MHAYCPCRGTANTICCLTLPTERIRPSPFELTYMLKPCYQCHITLYVRSDGTACLHKRAYSDPKLTDVADLFKSGVEIEEE
jgi:hypothetical protein